MRKKQIFLSCCFLDVYNFLSTLYHLNWRPLIRRRSYYCFDSQYASVTIVSVFERWYHGEKSKHLHINCATIHTHESRMCNLSDLFEWLRRRAREKLRRSECKWPWPKRFCYLLFLALYCMTYWWMERTFRIKSFGIEHVHNSMYCLVKVCHCMLVGVHHTIKRNTESFWTGCRRWYGMWWLEFKGRPGETQIAKSRETNTKLYSIELKMKKTERENKLITTESMY